MKKQEALKRMKVHIRASVFCLSSRGTMSARSPIHHSLMMKTARMTKKPTRVPMTSGLLHGL